ncbi:MAG: hypothetical protein HY291_08910 [Planctomycetes bacterium]|nr:hypothetical protein [Planctomycetota bacterium]
MAMFAIRFGLLGTLLACLFTGSVLGILFSGNEAWHQEQGFWALYKEKDYDSWFPDEETERPPLESPDLTRWILWAEGLVSIHEAGKKQANSKSTRPLNSWEYGKQLCEIEVKLETNNDSYHPIGFEDDDTLLFACGVLRNGRLTNPKIIVLHRRFPEWWWGHFYRPEVWLTIIFGSLWLWRVIRWFRERRKAVTAMK